MKTLHLSRSLYDELRAHSEEVYPYECCGALLGRPVADGWRVEVLVRAANVRTGAAQIATRSHPLNWSRSLARHAVWALRLRGSITHIRTIAAELSVTDFAEAHWIGCAYVITEVSAGKAAATNAFLLAGATEESKRFEPLALDAHNQAVSPIRN